MDRVIYTVFTTSGFYSSYYPDRPKTLEGMISYVVEAGRIPVAWAAEEVTANGGGKDTGTLRRESLAASRTIVLIDSKYVPKNYKDAALEDAPKEEAWPFRIGGIYKDNGGRVVRLDLRPHGFGPHHLTATEGMSFGTRLNSAGNPVENLGHRRLKDGVYPGVSASPDHPGHLVPGEVNENGFPLVQASAEATKTTVKRVAESTKNVGIEIDGDQVTSSHPADIAMMKNDGPAKPKKSEAASEEKPVSKAKPAMAAFGFRPDTQSSSHLVSPVHGSALLH
jgi:hypothetical protein